MTDRVGDDSDIRYSLSANKNIDGMSEKEYNHHGWAKVNDVLTQQELADFQQKVGEKAKNGQNWYMNLEDGRYMFAVGQDGVNSTLIISDGDFQHPSIEKVYRLELDNETDIEIVRGFIYDNEKSKLWNSESNVVEEIYGHEVIKSYSVENCASFYDLWQEYGETGTEGKGNTGGHGNLQNGRGSDRKTRIDFSLSDKVSSDDGIFFDGENADGWNVRGEDIALEDIGPVRKELNSPPKMVHCSTVKVLDVTPRINNEITRLIGFDATGYEIYSNTDTYKHIEKRHGENGNHDQSMSDMRDVALMGYVLEEFDSAELVLNSKGEVDTTNAFVDKDGKPSKMVKFSKEIDGVQHVVIATPENKYKKLWVLSEYIEQNNKDTSQTSYDNTVLPPTPKANSDNVSSEISISQNQQNATENQKFSISGVNARTADNSGTGKVYSKKVKLTDIAWVDPTQGQYAKVTDRVGDNSDIRYSLSSNKDIDGMSEMEYNHHGWAKINDVLTQQELADFQQKVGEKAKNGQNWYMNLEDGRYMFAVGRDGVNSTLVISDGDFQHPSIEKVYQINADNETDIEVIRDGIYRRESKAYRRNDEAFNREKNGKWSQQSNVIEERFRDGIIREYGKSDFFTLQELRGYDGGIGAEGKGNTGGYGNLPNGRGSNQKTRIDFSLSDKVSSDDGIFFDGENADDWNVRGKDIALEDIGPVRKDIVQEEKTEWELLEEWLRESQEADKVSDVQQVEKEPTIKQRNKEKLEKYESQLESIKESAERRISKNEELIAKREIERRDLKRSYDAKIAAKREQYEAKKNKDTKAAS